LHLLHIYLLQALPNVMIFALEPRQETAIHWKDHVYTPDSVQQYVNDFQAENLKHCSCPWDSIPGEPLEERDLLPDLS
jgi:hypothetical protein